MAASSTSSTELTADHVWREFGTQLRAFVRRRVSAPERADDVIGDIALRIHQNVGRIEDRDNLLGWVYRIARNAIIDEYRRAARDRTRLEPLTSDTLPEAAEAWDEDQPGALHELATCMRPLLAGLPPEQRRALQLTEFDGMTQVEAARLEGISVSGMKSRVQRGRHRLAELLGRCCALTLDARGVPMDYTAPAGCHCGDG